MNEKTKILILADDLTGTNDTGATIRKLGWRTGSVVDVGEKPEGTEHYSCVSVNVDSRSMPEGEAAERTRRTVTDYAAPGIRLYSKRIDSTLRGNLGAETDAFIEGLAAKGYFGQDIAAMIVPAFPHAGRTYHDDTLYVYGQPLRETAAARDPHRPVRTSSAVQLFTEQSARKTALVTLPVVHRGEAAVLDEITCLLREGYRNILFEADTAEEIAVIAAAVAKSPVPYIAVDPGTFTAALTTVLLGAPGEADVATGDNVRRELRGPVLAVIGSVNDVARKQTRLLLAEKNTTAVILDADRLLRSPASREAALDEAEEVLLGKLRAAAGNTETSEDLHSSRLVYALVLSGSVAETFVPISPEALGRAESVQTLAAEMNDAIAEAAARLLRTGAYSGLYTTGGDITSAVCARAGIRLIEIEDEILPLAVGGTVEVYGKRIRMATKGGMIGDEDATLRCIYYL